MTDTNTATQTDVQIDPRALAVEIERQKAWAKRRIGGPPPGFDPEAKARKVLAVHEAWLQKKRAEEAALRANPLYPRLKKAQAEANEFRRQVYELRAQVEELKKIMAEQDKARKTNPATALVAYGESDDVKQLTKRLQVMLPNAGELGTAGVSLVAQLAMLHGLDPLPGSDHIYAWRDPRKNEIVVTIGYKGLLHLARRIVSFTHESRPMTEEERAEHGLQDDEIGYVTELYELAKARECKELGIPYKPIIGTAVYRLSEHKKRAAPAARTPAWVAKKNSLKDALRQIVTTGQRLQSALDVAANAQADALAAAQAERVDGDTWRVALPDGDAGDQVIEGQFLPVAATDPSVAADPAPDVSDAPAVSADAAEPVQPEQTAQSQPPAVTVPDGTEAAPAPTQAPLFVDVETVPPAQPEPSDAYRAMVDADA